MSRQKNRLDILRLIQVKKPFQRRLGIYILSFKTVIVARFFEEQKFMNAKADNSDEKNS